MLSNILGELISVVYLVNLLGSYFIFNIAWELPIISDTNYECWSLRPCLFIW